MKSANHWGRLLCLAAWAAASMTTIAPVAAQENVRAIGAVIAPPELIAAYSCTTYAGAVFLPKAAERAKQLIAAGNDKQVTVARLLARYDEIVDDMCREVGTIFERNRDKVLDVYARQLPGNKSDITPFLATPRGSGWSAANTAFLVSTAPLVQYYALTRSVAPELLKNLQRDPDRTTADEIRSSSIGRYAQYERALLIQLLADDGFAAVVPARFNLISLKQDEVHLRRESVFLRYATPFLWFNNNASDLIRMHFDGFDVMREMGLADVYIKYGQKLEEALRKN